MADPASVWAQAASAQTAVSLLDRQQQWLPYWLALAMICCMGKSLVLSSGLAVASAETEGGCAREPQCIPAAPATTSRHGARDQAGLTKNDHNVQRISPTRRLTRLKLTSRRFHSKLICGAYLLAPRLALFRLPALLPVMSCPFPTASPSRCSRRTIH